MAAAAIQPLEVSVRKAPTEPTFQYHLGMAYMQTGEWDKAKRALKEALALKSDFDGASDARTALSTIGA
jgi:Flp pilus assembly protein TadD